MPYFYDLNRNSTTSGTAGTISGIAVVKTAANQETLGIYGLFGTARYLTAGGASLRIYQSTSSTGGIATGGTSVTPNPKNLRGSVAAQSVWVNDASAITLSTGSTGAARLSVGMAQTGGMGGYVPLVPSMALQMIPNSTVTNQPSDFEFASIAASTSVSFDWTIDLGEGI